MLSASVSSQVRPEMPVTATQPQPMQGDTLSTVIIAIAILMVIRKS